MDEASKDLISQLCLPDLSKRLKAAEQIKTHPYFTIDWEYVNRRQLVPPFVPRIKEIGERVFLHTIAKVISSVSFFLLRLSTRPINLLAVMTIIMFFFGYFRR